MEQIKIAKQVRGYILTQAASVIEYKNWEDEFSVKEMRSCEERIKASKEYRNIDPSEFTQEELDELGFGLWDDSGLMLIPVWLLPYLCDEFQGACISDGEIKTIKRVDMDNDHRSGNLAFGVRPKKGEQYAN